MSSIPTRGNEIFNQINQIRGVSRAQQGRQGEPSAKTLRFPLSNEWRNSTLRFASTPGQINGKININKYFFCSLGDRTHNQSRLQSHFVPLRHDWR